MPVLEVNIQVIIIFIQIKFNFGGFGVVSAEFAEKSETTPCTLEVIVAGSKVTLNTHYTGKVNTVECQMGQEFKDKMPNGLELDVSYSKYKFRVPIEC